MSHTGETCPQSGIWSNDCHRKQIALSLGERFPPCSGCRRAANWRLVRATLAHALTDAGYQTVAAPACAGCGRITADLRRKTASGRVCGTCAARDSKGTCARCGQARRIYARRPEGGICSACYDKDEQVVTECSGCGWKRRAATRMPDGSARCQFCATRPVRTCSACGQQRTTKARWRSARSAGKPGPATGSPPAARSAATAGPDLPGHASGVGATVPSRRNGPSDRPASAAMSMSAATLVNAQAAERYGP